MTDFIKKMLERGVIVNQDAVALLNDDLAEKIISSGFKDAILTKKHIEPFLKETGLKIVPETTQFKDEYEIAEFADYYEKKYEKIRGVLQNKIPDAISINKLALGKKCSIIGVVKELQGDDIIVEDKTGRVQAMTHNEKLEQGDVIGLSGSMGNDRFFIEETIVPDVSSKKNTGALGNETRAIFISDIHYGAPNFKKEAFDVFLKWVEEKNVEIVFVAGDLSNNGDYGFLDKIPDDVAVVIIPGETDSNALQPLKPIQTRTKRKVCSLPNPGRLAIENNGSVEILLYHPESKMDRQPEDLMMAMLRKRSYTPRQFLPIQGQFLIESEPDIICTGHFHKPAIKNYKSITLVSCGSFVDDPTFVIVNLKTRETTTITF